jgi:TatD DNase family protein
MEFADTHCHIQEIIGKGGIAERWQKGSLSDADAVIEAAKEAAVTRLICVGTTLSDSRLAADFAKNYENCWASIGVHPHEAVAHVEDKKAQDEFTKLIELPKVVAVGECGLDYFYEHSPKKAQVKILRFQIELALKNNLPIIFHVREAFEDFWPIFESYKGIRGVLHSFTDSAANLERALEHNLYVGINGIATFAKNTDVYQQIPLEKVLLETDAPFLAPVPYRGKVNQPKYIPTIAEFLTKLRGESVAEIATATTRNAKELFSL